MIPHLVRATYRRSDGRERRLSIPALVVLVVVSPLLPLAGLAGLVVCLATRISPIRALSAIARLVGALPGTRIEVEHGPTVLRLSIT